MHATKKKRIQGLIQTKVPEGMMCKTEPFAMIENADFFALKIINNYTIKVGFKVVWELDARLGGGGYQKQHNLRSYEI